MAGSVTRHLKILDYALSSLWRRKFKKLSVIAVYTFTIAVLASVLLLTQSLRVEASRLLEEAPDVVVQRIIAGRHDLIPVDGWSLSGAARGGEVHPRYWGYYYDAVSGSNYTLMALPGDHDVSLRLIEGGLPNAAAECAIGRASPAPEL